jgi:hypothetical protein
MFLFKRKKEPARAPEPPVDPDERSPQLGIRNKDLAVLGQLMAHGADLTKPRHAVYYLYFADGAAAEAGGEEARAAGYSCEVREPLPVNPGQWSLVCERSDVILNPPNVIAADDLFQGIADRHGAEFDGWEAAARP